MVLPRIPYTTPFPAPTPFPATARTLSGAVSALTHFLQSHTSTLLLTGAGISVASGLSDYRGKNGTYRLNEKYRPIFFSEFTARHESRQRYWARSFLGWPQVERARRNGVHVCVDVLRDVGGRERGDNDRWKGIVGLITQNVDSLHGHDAGVVELHGTLRTVVCLNCGATTPRTHFQSRLERLNPSWAAALSAVQCGGLTLHANPDGDVDVPGVVGGYAGFQYPPCEQCVPDSDVRAGGGGVLKPSVTFFGESVAEAVKRRAEAWLAHAGAVCVLGSSLATYSAWRLVRDMDAAGKGVAVVNLGGVRGEDVFYRHADTGERGMRLRVDLGADEVLRGVVQALGLGTVGEGVVSGVNEEGMVNSSPGPSPGLGG